MAWDTTNDGDDDVVMMTTGRYDLRLDEHSDMHLQTMLTHNKVGSLHPSAMVRVS